MIEELLPTNNRRSLHDLGYAAPSAVSVFRILLAAFFIVLISRYQSAPTLFIVLAVTIIFSLDAVDGILARILNRQSLIGSFIDIAADRIVEFIFLQHFLSAKLIPHWFVAVFYGRILLTDACRVLAFGMEKVSATGIELPRALRPFVLSKISRTGYGTAKAAFFGVLLLGQAAGRSSPSVLEHAAMFTVLAFSLLRATPIVYTYLPTIFTLKGSKLVAYTHPAVHDVAPRSTKIVSWLQFFSDIGLATWLLVTALR